MDSTGPELWLLGGVTAAGKTGLSIKWAEKNNAEIISCDSVSFYRGLDVGSAKPSIEDQKRIPHHGIDLAEVSETFDVQKFHNYASGVVDDIISRGKKVLVVGGSGFFLEGFVRPVIDQIEVSEEVRQQAQNLFQKGGADAVHEKLIKMNPDGLGDLDTKNPVRMIHALERCMQSGRTVIELQREFKQLPIPYSRFSKHMIWLDREDHDLTDRISYRTKNMITQGMIEETKRAMNRGILTHPSLASSVGYREVITYIENGGGEKEELISSIAKSTRQLVSKQRKWFRKRFPDNSRYMIDRNAYMDLKNLGWVAVT